MVVEEGLTVQGKSLTEHQEAINHAQAFDFIQALVSKKRQELTARNILDIHSIILSKIDDTNKGRYRNVAVRLRGSETILPNALKVAELMEEFIGWLQGDNADHPVKIAVEPERASTGKPTPGQRFYTTEEVAKLLQVDPESVRRYVRRGNLRAVKLGGKFIRIDKADLDAFIETLKS